MYAIKTEVSDPQAASYNFAAVPTMYGGKHIARGNTIYVFASETSGSGGLIACGVVGTAEPVPRQPGVAKQTPRVSISVERTALARRPLGRSELKACTDWTDGRPQTELNFKLYRQATDKIVGLSDAAAAYLATYF